MANRWGNNGNSERLYFFGSKITADGDCGHKIKRHLLLGRKVKTNLDSILKSRDITLPVEAVVFPVVIYGCESWTVKKAEHRRIDAFQLWCWRRLLRAPWTARGSILFMSIKSVMLSSHLILCRPLLLLPPIPPASKSFPMSQLFT